MNKLTVDKVEEITDQIEECFKEAIAQCCGKKGSCDNCCSGCAVSNAHFDYLGIKSDPRYPEMSKVNQMLRGKHMAIHPEVIKLIAPLKKQYAWTADRGFWKVNGCSLPRKFRSVYCQSTHCRYMIPYLRDIKQINRLIQALRQERIKLGGLI